jgi:isocitrate lyase
VIIFHLDSGSIAKFQRELGAMDYEFQFGTLTGFHALNYNMFQLAQGYRDRGMEACAELRGSTEHEHFQ